MIRLSRRQVVVGASAAGLGLLAGCGRLPWQAQEPKVARIGYLSPEFSAGRGRFSTSLADAFREGLRGLGYVEGQNIVIEYRVTDGRTERLSELAAELVRLP